VDESELIGLLRERLAKLEAKLEAAEKALNLAQTKIDSRAEHIIGIVTAIVAVLGFALHFFKH
jgi:hypothetical protein